MSLRYALLGFLTTEPASGYRLAQEFGESMGWFWYASHSQIHPELKRLEDEGLVKSDVLDGGRGKKLYSITDAGRERLDLWLGESTDYAPIRDVERIRLVFLDQQPHEVIRKHFEAHRDRHQNLLDTYSAQLGEVREGTFPRLRKRLASQPQESHEYVAGLKVLALQGNVMRARNEISWAEDALLWLESVATGQESEAP
jgi:PadR family transcriptional regulator, regulatory protein AphA